MSTFHSKHEQHVTIIVLLVCSLSAGRMMRCLTSSFLTVGSSEVNFPSLNVIHLFSGIYVFVFLDVATHNCALSFILHGFSWNRTSTVLYKIWESWFFSVRLLFRKTLIDRIMRVRNKAIVNNTASNSFFTSFTLKSHDVLQNHL